MSELAWPLRAIPRILTAGQFPLADHDFSTTYRGRAHALHLHSYAGRIRLAGAEIGISPGDLTLSPAGLPSAYDLKEAGRHWCVHFEGAADDGDVVRLPLHIRFGAAQVAVRERFAHISGLHARTPPNPIARTAASLALQGLLLSLAEHLAPPDATLADGAAMRAADIIDRDFHEPLTVPDIARATGCSHGYLARAFRARFGVTMAHRLVQRRVEHARYLLESTDLPIWRVAERVGIPDPHHFNKTVRRLLGASPSVIRRAAVGMAPVDPDR